MQDDNTYVSSFCKEITQSAGHTCSVVSPRLTDNNASCVIEQFRLEEHISDKDKRQEVDRAGRYFVYLDADNMTETCYRRKHTECDLRTEMGICEMREILGKINYEENL